MPKVNFYIVNALGQIMVQKIYPRVCNLGPEFFPLSPPISIQRTAKSKCSILEPSLTYLISLV